MPLKNSDDLLKILALSGNATAIYETEEIIIRFANDAMIAFWGKDRTVIGRPLEEAIPELRGQPFKALLQEVWRTGVTYQGTATPAQLVVDGKLQTFYYDFEYRAIKDETGETYAILNTATDVSARVHAELKEKESRDTLALALEAANFGTWHINAETRELIVNERLKELFGFYPGDEVSLELCLAQITGDYRDQVKLAVEKAITRGGDYDLTHTVRGFHDGQLRWVRAVGNLQADASGEFSAFTGVIMDITEQVKAQEAIESLNKGLLQARDRLYSFIIQAPAGICVLSGPDLVYELVNPGYSQLLPGRGLLGRPILEALPELVGTPIEQLLSDVYHKGQEVRLSELYVPLAETEGGKLKDRYFTFTYQPRKNELGAIDGILAFVYDVTEHVKARKELAIAHDNVRNIILQAPVAMALFREEEMVIEEINDAFLELWNRDRSVVGKRVLEALPELEGQPYPQIMQQVFRSGETYYGNEAQVVLQRHGQLEEGYFDFINQAFRNSEGEITGIVVVAHEVTKEVDARHELEKVYEQARLSKEAAELGTFDMDLLRGTLEWDERCRTLFGISHQEKVTYDHDFVNGLHPDDRQRVLTVIANVMDEFASGGNYDVEYRTIGAGDGQLRWVRAKGRVYFGSDHQPVRFIGSVLDITEQKMNEIRKSDFIGMVSHELKTPLTSLNAILQVADRKLKDSADTFMAGAMQKANVQVKRMSSMINGFLNISRLESAELVLQKSDFDLKQLIEDIIAETRLTVNSHHIEINTCDAVTVSADREKINSVITNLIHNAIKYSPKGKLITVHCSIDANEVKVSIQDEGMGIKASDLPKIFDRYYRVESDHTQHISGFGIGLYLSAEIIRRHNGRIWADSEKGVGSTFYFTLPLIPQPDARY
ncbi:PAS domain-containing protein [Mucilaginibacter ginsenosidivorax]|uniref:histidine kinase n=1 Tax=Mucilaginibacter ginsenosidivorax TaxID=862126 RepID=A0A5B8VT73_9SPHI|nr:PAS domain-containing protein [Mucilaginibacter ginsenosidivorax]QEC74640.1 PAS domain S-box protein [Mucilaginibacter ginsenosidivorax]